MNKTLIILTIVIVLSLIIGISLNYENKKQAEEDFQIELEIQRAANAAFEKAYHDKYGPHVSINVTVAAGGNYSEKGDGGPVVDGVDMQMHDGEMIEAEHVTYNTTWGLDPHGSAGGSLYFDYAEQHIHSEVHQLDEMINQLREEMEANN